MTDPNAHVPMGTVYDMHTAAPRTVQRDFDTALIPSMRIDEENIDVLIEALRGIKAAIREYKAEVAEDAREEAECCSDCGVNYVRGNEHRPGCTFGPEAYKRHHPSCICWDCKAARETTAATAGEEG